MTDKQLYEVEKFVFACMRNSLDEQHDFSHVDRVRKNAIKIAQKLRISKQLDLNLLQAMCLLHDYTYSKYKASIGVYIFEGKIIKSLLSSLLDDFGLSDSDKVELIQAVSLHPHSFPFRRLAFKGSIYAKILQDADTQDFFYEKRVESFIHSNRKYKITAPLSNLLVAYGRKNLGKYLNFPSISI